MQAEIINNTYRLGGLAGIQLTNKNMSKSRPVNMHASITTPGLAANHNRGNGLDRLCIVERPDVPHAQVSIHFDVFYM